MKQVFLQDKSIDLWLETSLKKKKKKSRTDSYYIYMIY